MPVRLGKWFVVLAVVFATGSHWFFLQSIAWVGMAVEFSRSEPIATALEKTFSGQHPCGLCKVVQEGRKTAQEQKLPRIETKFDFFCESAEAFTRTIAVFELSPTAIKTATARAEAPLLPPPRFS